MSTTKITKEHSPSGNVDGVYHDSLTGWFSLDGTDQEIELVLLVNGHKSLTAITNVKRLDVKEHLGYGGKSGFSFDLSELHELNDEQIVELEIRHKDSGYDFNGYIMKYCRGISKDYNLVRGIFYPEYYRCQYNCCELSNEQAFQHFIKVGIFEGRDPSPWFSSSYYQSEYPDRVKNNEVPLLCYLAKESELEEQPSMLFDPFYYKSQYSDLDNAYGLLWHFTLYGRKEGRIGAKRELPAGIIKEFDQITELEPNIVSASHSLEQIVRYPYVSNSIYLPRIVHENVGDDIQVVICVPFISRGGADLVSTLLFRAYQGALGKDKVLMLVTDRASIEVPEWIDEESKVIVLDEQSSFVDDEEKLNALHNCLGRIAPEKIINVNSHTAWKLFDRYGIQLASVADLYACLFCFDFDRNRRKVGYITEYLAKTLPCLKAVYFDNQTIIDDVQKLYRFNAEQMQKLHTVYIPASEPDKRVDIRERQNRDCILWAGRLSIQKRPDVLIEVANSMPNQLFHVYGQPGNAPDSDDIVSGKYPNILYCGVFNDLDELDFDRYIAFLNTSEWEGIPTIIIQTMAMGLPVITSSVGGLRELITEDNGWLVEDLEDPEEYILAIRRVTVLHELTLKKVARAMDAIESNHSWRSYYKKLESLNAFERHDVLKLEQVQFKERRKAA